MIKEGEVAPDFELQDHTGKIYRLSDYYGKKNIVVYFYPKDNTPGCTKQACSFRDQFPQIDQTQTQILGISADSFESHEKFVVKYNLPFPLLSDSKRDVIKSWQVWGKKSLFGKTFHGILRVTVIINKKGIVHKIMRNLKQLEMHGTQVLAELKTINN